MSDEFNYSLDSLFSDYRAEWSTELFGSMFVEPPYFSQLQEARPCVLIGGRGTGKTTSLRSLRFDSGGLTTESPGQPSSVGIYVRFNKNRVRAFSGAGLSQEEWSRLFAHYFNLLACSELCAYLIWQANTELGGTAADLDTALVSESLGFGQVRGAQELQLEIRRALVKLQLFVNNPQQVDRPICSIAEQPLRLFAENVSAASAAPTTVYCCLDEYENLLQYQQAVLNTYIKHAEPPLTYKIGMRKYGLQTRATTDSNDLLSVPDDYFEIDISSYGFKDFASAVVRRRLSLARTAGVDVPEDPNVFLEGLTMDEEADLLGAQRIATSVREAVASGCDSQVREWLDSLPDSRAYFLEYWSQSEGTPLGELAEDWYNNEGKWRTRLGNYQYSSLFWLAKGRRGVRIRKYYCGMRTLLGLASGNIRYFLEMFDVAVSKQIEMSESAGVRSAVTSLSPRAQTDAAVAVGSRRLHQVEGKSAHGTQLQRLVLAIGKVFFEYARAPVGRKPETNSFVLSGSVDAKAQVEQVLEDGVAHLAFEVMPRTKATSDKELRDNEYRLHPIFCAYFWFSHRKKRQATFSAETLLELNANPKKALKELMGTSVEAIDGAEAPQQLSLFSAFYEGGDVE